MLEAVGGVAALGTEWLLTYLVHSSVLIAAAWLAVRTGRVRAPVSQDLLWKFTALAGIVTATAAVLPRSAPQEIQVTARFDRIAELARPDMSKLGTEGFDIGRSPVEGMRVLTAVRGREHRAVRDEGRRRWTVARVPSSASLRSGRGNGLGRPPQDRLRR